MNEKQAKDARRYQADPRSSSDILGRQEKKATGRERERTAVYLPPDLAEWVRVRASHEHKEISDIVEEALVYYREKHA